MGKKGETEKGKSKDTEIKSEVKADDPPKEPISEDKKSESEKSKEKTEGDWAIEDEPDTTSKPPTAISKSEPVKSSIDERPMEEPKKKARVVSSSTEIKRKDFSKERLPKKESKTEESDLEKTEVDDSEDDIDDSSIDDVQKELMALKNEILRDEGASASAIKHKHNDKEKDRAYQRDEEYFINIDIKMGDKVETYRVRPNKDKVFAFICLGYDRVLKEPCYRYLKGYTYNQIIGFKQFIERYGCICGDKTNHEITIISLLDDLFERVLATPKEYPQKFIMFYLKKINVASIVNAYTEGESSKSEETGDVPEDDNDESIKEPDDIEDASKDE